ncbi:hypothetical protein BDW02DRAFT_369742 [Decorospora gaudefroyi]|uniref:Uncharacterized protein n=1 Tax=Decorospora gaudefroyi TaxID=184978 RepID=A0A6A5K8S3_9PLEO|nr:hypothetical protein BDW02DRAFT_369742 [Decorospora gaudefroyi]
MLRLRPSELTLTPDHVEETFCRLAHRQSSRAGTTLPPLPIPIEPSGRGILRRGPQRSTRDVITALGDIPILQPHQAVFTSVDEDAHDSSDHRAQSLINDTHTAADSTPSPHGRHGPAARVFTSPTPRMHLPFRPRRDRQDPSMQSPQDEQPVRGPRTPPIGSARHSISDPATRRTSITNPNEHSERSPSASSVDGVPGLRGGGDATNKDRLCNIAYDTPHAPSPLHQMQRLSSPPRQEPSGDPTKSPTSPHEERPMLFLQGYVRDTPRGEVYDFHAARLPRTEPHRRSVRPAPITRSLSSGAAPSFHLASQTQATFGPSPGHAFGTLPVPGPPRPPRGPRYGSSRFHSQHLYSPVSSNCYYPSTDFPQLDQMNEGSRQNSREVRERMSQIQQRQAQFQLQVQARVRQTSSEASAISAGYSYYGSLASGSRYPSSQQSAQDQFSRLQLDEGAPSRENNHVTQPANPFLDTTLRPGSSGSSLYSSPSLAGSGPHGLSPLPSMPYTRVHNDASSLQPSPGNTRQDTPGGYIEASTAAAQGLSSPLDQYAEHYQRYLRAQHVRQTMPPPQTSFPSQGGSQARRLSQGHDSRPYDLVHVPSGPRALSSRQLQHPTLRSVHRSSEHLAHPVAYGPQMFNRSGQPTRSSQRSTENAPVIPSATQGHFTHSGQVQSQRAVFERLQNPGHTFQAGRGRQIETLPFRHSMPHGNTSYHSSNRPPHRYTARGPSDPRNSDRSSSPFPGYQEQTSPGQMQPPHGQTHAGSPNPSPQIRPRQGSRQHTLEVPSVPAYRPARSALPPALALDHGSGTTSRRSRSPLLRATTTARTHRRIPPEQRDQENDGDRALMRREEGNVNARYGEEEQAHGEMNETPPRIGRVERRMLE